LGGGDHAVQVSVLSRVRSPAQQLAEHPAVVAHAADLVSCDRAEVSDLPARLLGDTLIVRDLDAARTLSALQGSFRLVTLQGELWEPDGTLTVGTHHAASGLLSRKSELRELLAQAGELDQTIAVADRDLAGLRERLAGLDRRIETQQDAIQVL